MRQVISLDGDWLFRHATDAQDRAAVVPMPWQAQFADLRQTSGRAQYRRSFARPIGEEAVLRFGAVSYLAEVSVNGVVVGRHEGGYLPFDCVIPQDILRDINEVAVNCLLPDGSPNDAGIAFAEIPHGKQSWYGPIGGIWQSVALETRSLTHLTHCGIVADLSGQVKISLTLPQAAVGAVAELAIFGPDGKVAGVSVPVSATEIATTIHVANPALWSPDSPNLYRLEVVLSRETALDHTSHSFGFRSISAQGGQLFLNGQPYYMRAVLDQDYYPEGICTPPSLEFLEDQLRKAKALGLNMLRCHIKVPDPRYYEVADRLGMLIWTEIPNVGVLTKASAMRLKDTMEGILARDGNHPCIVIWTLINEDWGTRLCDDPSHRAWLVEAFDWLKALDPTRLVCDNSPCQGNFHVKGDFDDFHYYRSVPERREEWDALTADFAQGADWTWTPFGDGVRRGDEPKIVSEFGVWGLPQPAQVQIDGAEPWWMETGQHWGDGAAYPHGIQNRFASLGLNRVFGDVEAFVTAAQWYQFANLKYEIEQMRAFPQIQGYVITEFTDVHWESNGLLDMNRNPRAFHDRFAEINADVVIVPQVARYSATVGEDWGFEVTIASGGAALAPGQLRWQAQGAGGELAFPGAVPLTTTPLGRIKIDLPDVAKNQMLTIGLELVVDGRVVQRNQVDIALFARRSPQNLPTLAIADAALAERARSLGYAVVAMDAAEVILTHALSEDDIRRLQHGARYVVLADGTVKTHGNLRVDDRGREQPFIPVVDDTPGVPIGPIFPLPNIALMERHGTMWRGDWIAGFSWIRRDGAFADLPGGPLLDLAYSGVVPRHVMGGWSGWEFGGPVIAGLVVGWVHKPVALIGERRVGRGNLLATTFRLLTKAAGDDPMADALFDAAVAHARSLPIDV
jgi:hypothetical protein